MHPRPARSLAPLPALDEFAEAVTDPADVGTTPARLLAVIRVLAEATRASLSARIGETPIERDGAPAPGHAAG